MSGFTQRVAAVAAAAVVAVSGCAEKRETQQAAQLTPTEGTAVHSAQVASVEPPRGAYAELAVRRGGVPGEDGKLQGGKYVPVEFMQLPQDHQIGNRLFKYEGPGWESEHVAYRLYFDERAAIDIFGKTKSQLVLPEVGQDGTDYHALSDWGMDVLKVGKSLGLGGIGAWGEQGLTGVNAFSSAQLQVHNGADASGVDLKYSEWQTPAGARDLDLQLRIAPGSRLTHVRASTDEGLPGWATGIVRHGLEPITLNSPDSEWGYLATWGQQSLADDNLGMVVFFRTADLTAIGDDAYNHLVQLKGGKQAEYYFAGVWRAEGIDSEAAFREYLQAEVARLNQFSSPGNQ
ncbi:DUF4861 family protein [Microbulbifer hydrolyticus]|uniref:DUF4861 domain-containing protein n=1 Tax=Microbulbifer hydrolyticus TaxID=48074 RepID=A0A6P1TC85_9GAMM|nr:DUF4861 family protein [Microbulbifer hydrolyticus]MBB5213025.1 hypothetical protein [Microbulbifer hydrolyticus]QHQ40388.1 DUF4861 domain-containing protein [Microbulbifer hydrolyticus]